MSGTMELWIIRRWYQRLRELRVEQDGPGREGLGSMRGSIWASVLCMLSSSACSRLESAAPPSAAYQRLALGCAEPSDLLPAVAVRRYVIDAAEPAATSWRIVAEGVQEVSIPVPATHGALRALEIRGS